MMLGDDRDELRLDPVAHGVADHPLVLGQERLDAVVVHAPELLHGRPLYSRTGLEPHGIEVRVVIVRVHALARLQPGDGGVGERRGRRLVEDLEHPLPADELHQHARRDRAREGQGDEHAAVQGLADHRRADGAQPQPAAARRELQLGEHERVGELADEVRDEGGGHDARRVAEDLGVGGVALPERRRRQLPAEPDRRHHQRVAREAQPEHALGAARHEVVAIDLRAFGGSALTADIAVPKDRSEAEIGKGIPVTYVPARNTIFLSYALAWAETLGAQDIFIGVNGLDYSGYPDCRPEYVGAFERMANLATKAGVEGGQKLKIHTPLIHLTKAEIIAQGAALGVDFALTLSCYDPTPDGAACGRCDACLLRRKGFAEAGLADPTRYRAG